jgi:hypothetical protein
MQTPFIANSSSCQYKHRSLLKERCLHRQLEESAMNDAYTVCIDNLRSQLWSVFVLTTWGVNYERCFYWQLEESAMNGVCMDNLIVIANTDWLIDWWFLSAQVQIFHAYSGREKVQQYLKYTLKWVRNLQPGQPFVIVIGIAWWVGCGHKVKLFLPLQCAVTFWEINKKGVQRAGSITYSL